MLSNKRWPSLFTLLVVLAIIVTACGGTPAPAAPTAAEAQQAEPPAAPGEGVRTVVYLSAGTADVEQDWNEKWVKEFNDTHDDIQIQYELVSWSDLLPKTAAMIAAGTPPDIAWYAPSQIKEWYLGGLLEPLDDWIKEDLDEQLEPIKNPESSDIYYDGHYYGLPFCLAGNALIVRKDHLEEAGYNADELFGWDWDKFLEVAAAVTKPPDRYAMAVPFGEPRITAGYATPALMLSNGMTDLTDFSNKDAYIESLQAIKDLFPYSPPAQVTWKHADALTAYMNGVTTMVGQGSYFYGDIKRQAPEVMSDEQTVALPFPTGPRLDKPVVPWYTVGWVMFKASQNKEAAAEVLHFLGSKEAVNEWPMNMAPREGITLEDRVRVSEFGEDLRWWLVNWETLMTEATPFKRPGYAPSTEIDQIFAEELLRLYNDEITVEETYENLKARIEPIVIRE